MHRITVISQEGSVMAATAQHPEETAVPSGLSTIDYEVAEGLRPAAESQKAWREWMMVAVGLVGLVALLATIVGAFALASDGSDEGTVVRTAAPAAPATGAPAVGGRLG